MQWRRLSVWSVNFNFNTLSCQNYFFPEGMGGVHKRVEIPEEWGSYFCVQKLEILGRRRDLHEIPSAVGVWIFSGTTQWLM